MGIVLGVHWVERLWYTLPEINMEPPKAPFERTMVFRTFSVWTFRVGAGEVLGSRVLGFDSIRVHDSWDLATKHKWGQRPTCKKAS